MLDPPPAAKGSERGQMSIIPHTDFGCRVKGWRNLSLAQVSGWGIAHTMRSHIFWLSHVLWADIVPLQSTLDA